MSAELKPAWQRAVGGDLTQTTIGHGRIYGVNKATSELFCLNLADGQPVWRRSFPGALDGPPTIVGAALFIGCRDGSVTCLRATDGALAWRHQAAPLDRLTLHNDRLESLWPVSSSVLDHNGLIYAAAGRNSYLDGGIRVVALDPLTGELRHQRVLEGPWPDKETLRTAVVTETDLKNATGPEQQQLIREKINRQYATGYGILGGEADLLVTDGTDLYMTQNKFDAKLNHIPLQRTHSSGYTPMGGLHLLANFGLLNDTMYHRTSRVFCDAWPAYGTGAGSAARSGSFVAVGAKRAYAAQHWEQGGYAFHKPGSGNRIVADALDTKNLNGGEVDAATHKATGMGYGGEKGYYRTAKALWQAPTPLIVRALLAASDGYGGDLIFAGGVVEGQTQAEWDQSTYYQGPGKLQVFNGADGKLLAEYDLPACPVFDGMSAAAGKLLIPLVNRQVVCLKGE